MPQPKVVPAETPAAPAGPRIEYRGFQNAGDCREYRLRVHLPEAPRDMRFRIPLQAFASGSGLRLQDGPDVCFQAVRRRLDAGRELAGDVITLDPSELQLHIESHPPEPPRWTSLASLPAPDVPVPAPAAPVPVPEAVVEEEPEDERAYR